MRKNVIRLTESSLNKIVKESVKRVINESANQGEVRALAEKIVSSLSDSDKKFAYDTFNNDTWDLVYSILTVLEEQGCNVDDNSDDDFYNSGI